MAHTTPCDQCNQSGLPILFTRYGAAYSSQTEPMAALKAMKPGGKFQQQPDGVAMQMAETNVRMMRAGYLYIYVATQCRRPSWHGYVAHPHGYVTEFDVQNPQSAGSEAACEPDKWGANRSLVWIKDAEDVTAFHFLFNSDPIDPEHLKNEIEGNLDKYTRSLDVAGWTKGKTSQKDTCQPGQLNAQVMEFAAMTNEKLRDACEPLLHGLMGASATEREWGPHPVLRETVSRREVTTGDGWGPTATISESEFSWGTDPGKDYNTVHGTRLKGIAKYLEDQKGVVVACEDPVGITQDLGHLQAEAQTLYTKWQQTQAAGFYKDVSNEWVFQSAVGGISVIDLVRKQRAAAINQRFDDTNYPHAPLPVNPQAATAEQARRTARREMSRQGDLKASETKVNEAIKKYFHDARAKTIIETQEARYKACEDVKAKLGADQNAWLESGALGSAMGRYSDKAAKIDHPGGGASLSVRLAQCMAGTESNSAGVAWIHKANLAAMGVLGRTICFNSLTLQSTWKQVEQAKGEATATPGADPTTPTAEAISDKAKITAARMGLGDKAMGLEDAYREARISQRVAELIRQHAADVGLADKANAFIDKMKAISDSDRLAKAMWPIHIATLLSVKSMKAVHGLPVSSMEAAVVRYTSLTGLITLGKQARTEATRMNLPLTDADAWKRAEQKIVSMGHATSGRAAAPNARAAAIAALLDIGQAMLKGRQLQVKGADVRTVVEMAGNTMQAIGSLADYRAKAFEETIFKGVNALDMSTAPAVEATALRQLNALKLKGMRLTAFKFLLPAAMISALWDASDALLSRDRGQAGLAIAQAASAFGTAFTITATGLAAYGVGSAMTVATLGLIGAALTLISVVFVLTLKEDNWVNWLIDNPLNLQRTDGARPVHKNLKDTQQQLTNVKAELSAA